MSSSTQSHGPSQLASSSLSTASSLMALQLISRLFTFILNQALFRLASPQAFGTAAIQFELLLGTILFLSREGVRGAALRAFSNKLNDKARQKIINLTCLPFLFGVPLALCTGVVYARLAGHEVGQQSFFKESIGVYAIAATIELMSEPMYNLAMANSRTSLRVRAEGLGITIKTIVTFLVLLYDARWQSNLALLAFAGGQLSYSLVVFCVYISHYGTRLLWIQHTEDGYFDSETFQLSVTMTSQSLVKHFLTEGDKFVLSYFSPLQDQGGYAIAVNYGSLIARIIFQPIEETSRVFFSKTLPTSANTPHTHSSLETASSALTSLLSVQISFSLILVVFGTAYAPILLPVILPRQYLATSAPSVLQAWIYYIPVLAVNGALESFVASVARPQQLNAQSRWMALFSVVYISSALTFYNSGLGDASLVFANIVNLSARILYAGLFVREFFITRDVGSMVRISSMVPSWSLLSVLGLARVGISFSETRVGLLGHLGVGIVFGVTCVGVWWITSGRRLTLPGRAKRE